jgi:hypothetical protein
MLSRLTLLAALILGSTLHASPQAPVAPTPGPQAPAELPVHTLSYSPGPLDNPLKGFMPYTLPISSDDRGYPFSLEFGYLSLKQLMTNWDSFDWAPMESLLQASSLDGNQAVVRVYLEYPDLAPGIPEFLRKSGIAIRKTKQWNTDSPDYDDPRTLKAITQFIRAWGKKYDGDPRIGFIQLGIVGLWGEWHLYPSVELMPKDSSAAQIVDAFDDSFKSTRLLVRYAHAAGGEAVRKPIGFHDDSFGFRELDGKVEKSVTLPSSLGGWDWSFLQDLLNQGAENRWTECPMGGELRPEIQATAFSDKNQVDDLRQDVQVGHISWLLNEKGVEAFKAGNSGMDALVRGMGYDLWVPKAYFAKSQKAGELRVGVAMQNKGVAPFYYPWKVVLALEDAQGRQAATWNTGWDLRQVQPESIAAYPDWGAGAARLPFGKPRYFEFQAKGLSLPSADYKLLLRVENPLAVGNAKKFRFSNQSQRPDGWLELGKLAAGN